MSVRKEITVIPHMTSRTKVSRGQATHRTPTERKMGGTFGYKHYTPPE